MSETILTIVIPTYNCADYISEAISSCAQIMLEEGEIEVCVVDDGSTDDTRQVVAKCREAYPDLHLNYTPMVHKGRPAFARNFGIQQASGTFILPLDADDYVNPSAITKMVEKAKSCWHKGFYPVIHGTVQSFGEKVSSWKAKEVDKAKLIRRNLLPQSSLYPKELWRAVGRYDETMPHYEDWNFWIRASLLEKTVFVPMSETVYYRRVRDARQSEGRRVHEWVMAHMITRIPKVYTFNELDWAETYLEEHPERPTKEESDNFELHTDDQRFPLARALLIAAYPNLYEESEREFARKGLAGRFGELNYDV